jgi:hypothetical protein
MTEHQPGHHHSEHHHPEHHHHEFPLVIDNRQHKWPKELELWAA